MFIYSGSARLVSFEIKLISKETSRAEQYNTIQYNIYLIQFENTGDGSCLNPIICTIVPLMVIIVN